MSSTESDEWATLIVKRPSPHWRDHLRSYVVQVDGVRAGEICSGHELVIPVRPGRHSVEARIDWTGSSPLEVVLRAGESVVLGVEPAGGVARSFDQLIGRHRYLTLDEIR